MELEFFILNTGTRVEFNIKILKIWKYIGTKKQKYLKPNKITGGKNQINQGCGFYYVATLRHN